MFGRSRPNTTKYALEKPKMPLRKHFKKSLSTLSNPPPPSHLIHISTFYNNIIKKVIHIGTSDVKTNVHFASTIFSPKSSNFSVCSLKWKMFKLQYDFVVCTVQCSMCSMKWTGASICVGSGAGAVCNVLHAVCSV